MTVGEALAENKEINSRIQGLVAETTEKSLKLREVRPPDSDKLESYEGILKRFSEVRGRPLFYPYVGTGAGSGPYVELADGSVKIDFINGIGVHIFGHGHPVVLEAATRGALQDIVMQGHLQMNDIYLRYSEKIIGLAKKGSRLRHGWLSPSGSMANENALKLARQKILPHGLQLL